MKKEIDYGQLLRTPEFESKADKFVEEVNKKYRDYFLFFHAENITKELPKRLLKGGEAMKKNRQEIETDDDKVEEKDVNDIKQISKDIISFEERLCNLLGIGDVENYTQEIGSFNTANFSFAEPAKGG